MATIVTRSGKGSPLTNTEVDANFTNLNNDKLETNAEVRAAVEAASDSNVFTDADHTKLNAIEANATADQTAAEILTAIKTVDGTGSGLDADTLDGVEASALLPLSGGTMTGDLAYGDNVKATFGNSADLQVFHDGLNSYITDGGTGNLMMRAGDFTMQNPDGSETLFEAVRNGAVKLWYDAGTYSNPKLQTTATGVDVTGTITANELTVDGGVLSVDASSNRVGVNQNSPSTELYVSHTANNTATLTPSVAENLGLRIKGDSASNTTGHIYSGVSLGEGYAGIYGYDGGSSAATGFGVFTGTNADVDKRITVDANGDISFYDTSENAKLLWDASATALNVTGTVYNNFQRSNFINNGDWYDGVNWEWVWGNTNTNINVWYKVADMVWPTNGQYDGGGFLIELITNQGNYGSSTDVASNHYNLAVEVSQASAGSPDQATFTGTDDNNFQLRAIKTAAGVYELQIKCTIAHRFAMLKVQMTSTAALTLTPTSSLVAGSTSGTAYLPAESGLDTQLTHKFQRVEAATLAMGDNNKATFGDSDDLQIYHDGLNSYITDGGTGSLYIKASNNLFINGNTTGDSLIFAQDNGPVRLYYDGSAKFETTATGVDVTGTVQADQFNNDEALPDIRPSLLLDFANSKTLDPRITFTRGSTATYYDGKTTAKAEENLVPYSQEFTQSVWSRGHITVAGDDTTAPDGTTTASTITSTSGQQYHQLSLTASASISASVGNIFTFSFYVKRVNWDYIQVQMQYRQDGSYVANAHLQLDLSAGTTSGTSSLDSYSVTDVGNSWYKVVITDTAPSGSYNQVTPYVAFSDSNSAQNVYNFAGTEQFEVWGAQLEQRSSATAYTPTTSAPIVKYQPVLQTAASGAARFDHSPTTGESKGLLIEEARTNLFTYSVDYSHSNWIKNNLEVDDNVIIAPDGTLTGGLLKENTASGSSQHNMSQAPTVTTQHYTMSAYFKEPTIHSRRYVGFTMYGMAYAGFDIQAGTTFNYGSGLTSQTITDVGNGWYYCTATWLKTNTDAGAYILLLTGGSSSHNYAVDGTQKGMHIWGAQLEAGSFPTSYIATAGSTATRAVDAAAITGSNLTYAISQTSGTLYGSGVANETGTAGSKPRLAVLYLSSDTGINKNSISIQRNNGAIEGQIYYNGVSQAYFFGDNNQLANYATGKVALGYELNSANLGSNGTIETTDTVVNAPYVDVLRIGGSGYGQYWNGTIDKIAIYPKRLSNATLQAMTTE